MNCLDVLNAITLKEIKLRDFVKKWSLPISVILMEL